MRRVPTPARTTLLDGAPPTPAGGAIPASAAPPQPSPGTPRPPGTRSTWPGTGPGGGRPGKGANAHDGVAERTAAQGATASAWTGTGAPRRTTAMWSAQSRRRSCRGRPMPRDLWQTRQVVARTRVMEDSGRQRAGAPPRTRTKWDAPYLRGPRRGRQARQASCETRQALRVMTRKAATTINGRQRAGAPPRTTTEGGARSRRAPRRGRRARQVLPETMPVRRVMTGKRATENTSADGSAAGDDGERARSVSSRASSAEGFIGDDAGVASSDTEESHEERWTSAEE